MDEKEIRTLHILESIARENPPSQRDLAKELNISLGLVNAIIKGLVKRGLFKVGQKPNHRFRYSLTAAGVTEKSRLIYAYIRHSYDLYQRAQQTLHRQLMEMEVNGIRRIVLYGASDLAEVANRLLTEGQISLVGIIDDARIGQKIAGRAIQSTGWLKEISYDKILITSFEQKSEVIANLMRAGIPEEQIVTL